MQNKDTSWPQARWPWGAAVFLAATLPATAAQAQPATIDLPGIIRDFRKSHPDFNLSAAAGRSAGNIGPDLDINAKPVFSGGGYRVTSEWRDAGGNPIAPQLYNMLPPCDSGPGAGLVVDDLFRLWNQGRVDSYDSGVGPYGGANAHSDAQLLGNMTGADTLQVVNNSDFYGDLFVGAGGNPATVIDQSPNSDIWGSTGVLASPVPVPVPVEPTGLGPSVGNVVYGTSGIHVRSTDLHCNELTVQGGAVLRIVGNVTILAEGLVQVAGGRIEVPPGSTLKLYAKYRAFFSSAGNGNPQDPSATRVYLLSANPNDFVRVSNAVPGQLFAQVYAPFAQLQVTQSAEFYGTFAGSILAIENQGKLHVDESLSALSGAVTDAAGTAGASSNGGISSAATYGQWFQDVLDTNQSKIHTITLSLQAGGVYEYTSLAFHPIDNMLFGNEGDVHNQNLTYELAADFTYEGCAGQFVRLRGSDDFWVFIDGVGAMDGGGTSSDTTQYLDLDRLGLVDGQTCRLSIFYADRQSSALAPIFSLRTNLILSPVPVFTISGSYD